MSHESRLPQYWRMRGPRYGLRQVEGAGLPSELRDIPAVLKGIPFGQLMSGNPEVVKGLAVEAVGKSRQDIPEKVFNIMKQYVPLPELAKLPYPDLLNRTMEKVNEEFYAAFPQFVQEKQEEPVIPQNQSVQESSSLVHGGVLYEAGE